MLKASPDQCSQLIADLINAIVKEGIKGKGSALDSQNYCGLKHRSSAESSGKSN